MFRIFLLTALLCVPVPAQHLASMYSEDGSEESAQNRRRVVPSKGVYRGTPPLGRFFLSPFRALAPKIAGGLEKVEERKLLPRLQALLSSGSGRITPVFGGLGDGAGFAPGARIGTGQTLRNGEVYVQLKGTPRRYAQGIAGFNYTPVEDRFHGFRAEFAARINFKPEEDFWGVGPQSLSGQRATYNLQERGLGLSLSFTPVKRLRLGLGLDYSSNRVFDGRDRRFGKVTETFGRSLPGLAEGAALLGSSVFAELDLRDEPGNAKRGIYARFTATSNDSVGRGDFGYVQYLLDARGYIPLGTHRRVLALRFLGNFNEEKGGSQIPFFRLARLGDQNTMRGYDTYRFHDRHAAMLSVEYRYQLIPGLGAIFFSDIGQVYSRRSQFNTANIHATGGGGIQFITKRGVPFKILYAHSGEGSRVFFNFGTTF